MLICVTYFTKSALSPFFTRKLQLFIDRYKELLYYHAHNLITGDEEKSKCTSLAKRAIETLQEGAEGDLEMLAFRPSGCTRYSAGVLKGKQSLRT